MKRFYQPLPSTPIDLPQERFEQIIDEIEKARCGRDDAPAIKIESWKSGFFGKRRQPC